MSENNNGIHTKDDLEIKNLSLFVAASDNALKGNDSVEIENGKLTLIATRGDGIKTENSDISEKGNQRGTVSILGADVSLFSACDGIDAAYNVIIENDSATVNIYTDKYSNYSKEVSTVCSESDYILNTSIDHYSSENSFTSYLTTANKHPGGDGGFGGATEGNTEKGSYSTKGIKAANEIRISHGRINIKSYDDALHANTDTAIENGSLPLGRVYIGGGNITVYTNDDGVHADGEAIFEGGSLIITHCYEGIEGKNIKISSCTLDITATDDGINSSATSGRGVEISSGSLKIVCYGDGIDTNSTTSYEGIVISGGEIFIFTGSRADSTLDTENGYTFEGGTLFSVMQRGAMTKEAKHCENFSDIGCTDSFYLEEGTTIYSQIGGKSYSYDVPFSLQGVIIILGDKAASISVN